jgi:hypothetical protein
MLEGADHRLVFGLPHGTGIGLQAHLREPDGKIALLATMPMLDDVNITLVQRGDQSRGVVIPGAGGLAGIAGGHSQSGGSVGGRGGFLASGGPAGSRGGVSAGNRGGGLALAPNKGKQAPAVLDNDEVSSDKDKPMQKWPQRLSSIAGPSESGLAPAAPNVTTTAVATTDKEATDKRDAKEVAVQGPRRRWRLTRRPRTRGSR